MKVAASTIALVGLIWLTAPVAAQSTSKKKGDPKKEFPGYEGRKVEGFGVQIGKDVLEADVSGFERKPLDELERELHAIVGVLTPRAVKALRTVPIWVQWDQKEPKGGAEGAAAYYDSKRGQIVVNSLRRLTLARQPKSKLPPGYLLHEMAHVVHHQLWGYDDPIIKAAYQQAMDRKLYESVRLRPGGEVGKAYATKNDKEYFAELTVAYFDKGWAYPVTREQLKKHDPAGYKLMKTVWSAASK